MSVIAIVINILLFIFKFIVGIYGNSKGMVADAIHTLSDVLTTILVIVGIKICSKDACNDHQYGHEKFEAIIVKIMSMVLVFAGGIVLYNAVSSIVNISKTIPSSLSLMLAGVSFVVKEIIFIITIKVANKTNNQAIKADAYHHHADGLSSMGVFIGILGTRLGWWYLDAIGGIVVSLIIINLGITMYIKAIKNLVDHRAEDEVITKILKLALEIEGVKGIKKIKTRLFGNKVYSDLYIEVSPNLNVGDALKISSAVHEKIEKELLEIKHCEVILR